eukprot:2499289-Pleurochrysis_carterae.AAC.3
MTQFVARHPRASRLDEGRREEPTSGPEHPPDLLETLLQPRPRVQRRARMHARDRVGRQRQLRNVGTAELQRGAAAGVLVLVDVVVAVAHDAHTRLPRTTPRLGQHRLGVVHRDHAGKVAAFGQTATHEPRSARHVNADAISIRFEEFLNLCVLLVDAWKSGVVEVLAPAALVEEGGERRAEELRLRARGPSVGDFGTQRIK